MPHNVSQETKNFWMFLAGGYLYVGDSLVFEDLFYLKKNWTAKKEQQKS